MIDESILRKDYEIRYNKALVPLSQDLEKFITQLIGNGPHIDRICARAKSVDSFMEKALKQTEGVYKYHSPLDDIQDQIGARIITYFISDLIPTCQQIEKYFGPIEKHRKEPEKENEFGYEGYHYVLFIPTDLLKDDTKLICSKFFELQVRTLYQHAWAQADHDLAYKSPVELSKEELEKNCLHGSSIMGSGLIFDELSQNLTIKNN